MHLVIAGPRDVDRLAGFVTAAEVARAAQFHRPDDQARALVSRALLRIVAAYARDTVPTGTDVARWCPRCGRCDHGRPVLVDNHGAPTADVTLSAAHSGDVVVAAVSDVGLVGVDVERVGAATFDSFADSVLTAGERRALAAVPHDDQARWCAQVWTRKEALLKAAGRGLAVAPRVVHTLDPVGWPAGLTDGTWGTPVEHLRAHLFDLPAETGQGPPGLVGTVVVLTSDQEPPVVAAHRLPDGHLDPDQTPAVDRW